MGNNLWLKILGNTTFGLLLIYIWSRFVDINETISILKGVKIEYILVFFFFFCISTILRSIRLKLLLSNFKLSLKDLVMLNFLSQFLSFMIPIRAGEVAKSVYLNSQYDLPLGKTVVWIFIDRFLDFWVVLLLISGLLLFIPTGISEGLTRTIFVLFIAFSVAAALIINTKEFSKRLVSILSNLLVLNKLKRLFTSISLTIIEGMDILRVNPLKLLSLILISSVTFVSDGLIWVFLFTSLGQSIDPLRAVFGNMLFALTFLLPAAPGFVGSVQAASLGVWSGVMGYEANFISAVSVLFHIQTVVALLIFGIGSIYLLKFDLNLVWRKIRKQD